MKQNSEYLEKLLIQFQALIHKTMNRLNLRQHDMDYDDLTQELQLHLLTIFESFQGDPLRSEADRYKFTAYAGRGLYWHGLNLLRQNKMNPVHISDNEEMDWLIEQEGDSDKETQTNIYIEDFLKQAQGRLSEEDYSLLLHIVEGKYTMDELAGLMGVSRDTIYQRKKKIQQRLLNIKDCLTH